MQPYVTVPEQDVPVVANVDVGVVGSGPAGICAALAAARSGASVCLLEAHGCLGGVWTAGQLAWMFEMDQPGIPREITQRLDLAGGRIPGHDPSMYTYDIEDMKLLLEVLCEEAGIQFQLHTRARACVMKGGAIDAVVTDSKSGPEAWRAKAWVDASGDGDLAALSGCGFDLGRDDQGLCQPMTFMALVSVEDLQAAAPYICFWEGGERHLHKTVDYGAVEAFVKELKRAGITPSYKMSKIFQVKHRLLALMANHEYNVSAIRASDLTRATVHGRAEIHHVIKSLQRLGGVWSGLQLVATCEQIGIREGRRVHGLYTVTREDLEAGRRQEDAICRVQFGVDIHQMKATPDKDGNAKIQGITAKPYDIPLRALISRDVSNLLLGGRCISGDFVAHSSYRVTGTAGATGQAAGVTAALAAQRQTLPSEVDWESVMNTLADKVKRV